MTLLCTVKKDRLSYRDYCGSRVKSFFLNNILFQFSGLLVYELFRAGDREKRQSNKK